VKRHVVGAVLDGEGVVQFTIRPVFGLVEDVVIRTVDLVERTVGAVGVRVGVDLDLVGPPDFVLGERSVLTVDLDRLGLRGTGIEFEPVDGGRLVGVAPAQVHPVGRGEQFAGVGLGRIE
jgi:hypothetical protein